MLRRLLFSACICIFLGIVVKADPIVVTGGLSVPPPFTSGTPFQLHFEGPDLSVSAIGGIFNNNIPFCNPCTASGGSLSATVSGSGIGGTVTFQGITYQLSTLGGPGTAEGFFQFTAPNFVLSAELLDEPALRIIAPFTLNGILTTADFQLLLTAQGTVTMILEQTPGGLRTMSLNYVTGNAPPAVTVEVVPEPTSMVFLISGIIGVYLKLRKRSCSTLHEEND